MFMKDFTEYKELLDCLPDALVVASGTIEKLYVEFANKSFFALTKNNLPIGSNIIEYIYNVMNVRPADMDILERLLESEDDSEEIFLREKNTGNQTYVIIKAFGKGRLIFVIVDSKRQNFNFPLPIYTSGTNNTDNISGLPNRDSFFSELKATIEKSKQEKSKFALLLLDLDNMKTINDTNGHAAGDGLIKLTSEVLERFLKPNIKAFRFGDDEFLLLVTQLENRNYMATVADAVHESLSAENISVSGGIVFYPEDSTNETDLLKFADVALYDAKAAGKNTILFFQSIMYQKFSAKVAMQYHLAQAFEKNEFQLYFQPQYDIRTNTLRGFEALLRWHDKDFGWISPEKFIPIAEETNLVVPIGKWVLDKACQTLKDWQTNHNFKGIMSINVSPIQLKKGDFLFDVEDAICRYKLDPKTVELEITEGVLIDNPTEIIAQLKLLKEMGFGISLDDFGTGYSSLRYLQVLPLTTLKIDKSFVTNLTSMESIEANITDSIITMVTKLGLDTIAEGVEYPEQMKVLHDLHCHNIQGFLKGRPMPKDECESILC